MTQGIKDPDYYLRHGLQNNTTIKTKDLHELGFNGIMSD